MPDKKPSILEGYESLEELGEFGLIEKIADHFGRNMTSSTTGIGDDCAILSFGDSSLLVTTDLLVENEHFKRDIISPRDLGYKALAINLSDISAMGGKPAYAFLSISLPADIPIDWLESFLLETHRVLETYDVKLMGGDTTKSTDSIFINYTVIGFPKNGKILWRSTAKPGDKIALLGNTGESGAGLNLLTKDGLSKNDKYKQLIDAHNRPGLHIEEAQFLAEQASVHAMIDISDGLISDARHIADKSGVSLHIDVDELPLSPILVEACDEFGWQALEMALTSGEDYSLLFTLDESEMKKCQSDFKEKFSTTFEIIGEVTDGPAELQLTSKGSSFKIDNSGYDHFKNQ